MTVDVEANLTLEMAKTMIFPAAIRYQSELAGSYANLQQLGLKADTIALEALTSLIKSLQEGIAELESAIAGRDDEEGIAAAHQRCDKVLPAMLAIREAADALEGILADDLWPLPTYQEMLFIK
jgi:glutamine synthetase